MRAIANSIEQKGTIEPFHFSINDDHEKVEIVDYVEDNDSLVISLYSALFLEDSFRFFFHGNKLVVVISERVQSMRPNMPVVDWHRFSGATYERLRNVSIFLPGDNFYLMRHFLVPEQYLLKLFLGQVTDN